MFKLTTDTKIPSVAQVVHILQEGIDEFGIPLDYDRMKEYEAYYTIRANTYLSRIIRYISSNKSVKDFKDSDFLDFLRHAGVTTGLIKSRKTGRYSLSKESLEQAVATGLYSEELCKLMQMYSQVKSDKNIIGPMAKIFKTHEPCGVETFDRHRMIVVNPRVVSQNTGRVAYAEPAPMNFARDIQDIITVPIGYIKCEADSGQIDPRISQSWVINDPQLKKCTMLYNDAYFGYIHFCNYLTDEQRRSGSLDFEAIEITPELKDKRQLLKKYGNSVMYGSAENRDGDQDKAKMIKYIGGHPNHVALQHKLEEEISKGQTIFHTAFGTPIDIMGGPSAAEDLLYSEEEQFRRKVNRALNVPIQGTAADLMRYSVVQANNMLLREAPNSRILMYVHDSGKFMVHESDYPNIADELKEIVSYQVEDWIPIYSDYQEGTHSTGVERFIV